MSTAEDIKPLSTLELLDLLDFLHQEARNNLTYTNSVAKLFGAGCNSEFVSEELQFIQDKTIVNTSDVEIVKNEIIKRTGENVYANIR